MRISTRHTFPIRWAALGALLLLAACASQPLRESWRDTAWTGAPLKKLLIAATQASDGRRRLIEDGLVQAFRAKGLDATASYTLVPAVQPTVAQLNEAAGHAGYDGLIVNQTITAFSALRPTAFGPYFWADGFAPHRRFYPYFAYQPYWGGFESEETVDYQTDVYATGQSARLVWTAATRVADARTVRFAAQSIANAVVPSLQASGTLSGAAAGGH